MNYRHFNIQICPLTPVHIGNGHSITSIGEYVSSKNSIRIINQEKLNKLLNSKGLYDDYLKHILSEQQNANIWNYFVEQGIENDIAYDNEYRFNAPDDHNPENNSLLELHIKTAGKKYLPGSTIKGTVRNSIFAYCISEDYKLKEKLENIINSANSLWKIKERINDIEKRLLDSLFKNIRPEDTGSIDEENTIVEVSGRQHLFGTNTEGLGTLKECIAENTEINTVLTIKHDEEKLPAQYLSFFSDDNTIGLFNAINNVTLKYIEFEISLLKESTDGIAKVLLEFLYNMQTEIKRLKNNECVLRMGKGKTYFFQTILPFLSHQSMDKVLNLMVKDDEKRRNFPQTRVLTGKNRFFGWIKITTKEKEAPAVSEITDNIVEKPDLTKTVLTAYIIDDHNVYLKYNGELYEKVQLINKYLNFEKNREIKVLLWQMTKKGRINQVKIID